MYPAIGLIVADMEIGVMMQNVQLSTAAQAALPSHIDLICGCEIQMQPM